MCAAAGFELAARLPPGLAGWRAGGLAFLADADLLGTGGLETLGRRRNSHTAAVFVDELNAAVLQGASNISKGSIQGVRFSASKSSKRGRRSAC
jgi:hypothetical protein